MKKVLITLLLCVPMIASAEHIDVIKFKLNDGCSFGKYMEIVNDFNEWGESNGYNARIAVPLQNDDLESWYWIGTSANAAAFGKTWDTWRDALGDADSTEAKLWARFQECEVNLERTGYDLY